MKGIACTLLFALFSASLFAAPPGKSVICHHDSEGGFWKPISISVCAVDSHLANHDDGYPNGATAVTGTELDENCEVVVVAETCPCFTYEEAMEMTTHPPNFCYVEEWTEYTYIDYDSSEGFLIVEVDSDPAPGWAECFIMDMVDGSWSQASGNADFMLGCVSIAKRAIEDGGYSASCGDLP